WPPCPRLRPAAATRGLPSLPTRRSSDLLDIPACAIQLTGEGKTGDSCAADECSHEESPFGSGLKNSEISAAASFRGISGSSPLRSEEHTSELQSRFDLVCRLLLAKKKAG